MRQPDVSFISLDRLPHLPAEDYISGAPDLAIEVVSPSDTAEDLNRKINQYLAAGGVKVWAAYPRTRQIHVSEKDRPTTILSGDDALTEPGLFPGWSVRVSELFP